MHGRGNCDAACCCMPPCCRHRSLLIPRDRTWRKGKEGDLGACVRVLRRSWCGKCRNGVAVRRLTTQSYPGSSQLHGMNEASMSHRNCPHEVQ